MRLLKFLILLALCAPAWGQEGATRSVSGYLMQTAITPPVYQLNSAQDLQSFVVMLPRAEPFKTLPADPNHDPFLHGYSPNFEESFVIIATGRDRIDNAPVLVGIEMAADGTRIVEFEVADRNNRPYPYGWAVYSGVVLPRIDAPTKVVVNGTQYDLWDKPESTEFKRADFQRAEFERAKFKRL